MLPKDTRPVEMLGAFVVLSIAAGVAMCWNKPDPKPADLLPHTCHIREPDGGQGSGVRFTRTVNGQPRSYVLTAAHVVNMTKDSNGMWRPVQLTFPVVGDHGRVIGKRVFQGKVIRYCPNNDLALLRILGDDSRSCVRLASEGPELDDNLFILASPYGIDGFASLTRTILSHKNRNDEGELYEQIQGGVMLGSSGGGVFDSRGQLVGIVQKLYHPTGLISFAAPLERIRSWASDMNCAWAFDTSIPVAYDDILIEAKKIPEAPPLSLEYWLFLFGQGK